MDDGGSGSSKNTILHTRSYTLDEVSLLQLVLMSNLKLNTKLYEKTSGQWVINIPLNQEIPLKDIVLPYMHASMLYKV